jgi:hypothetical protein
MYNPQPLDTEKVVLPEDLENLMEKLAENVHENWAASRKAEGWAYGPVRDDARKTTPCMVPYAQLSEEEKEYDRTTALQTLKTILMLGYKIEKNK